MQVTDFKFHVYIASSNGQQRECLLFLRYRPARSWLNVDTVGVSEHLFGETALRRISVW